MKRVPVLFPDIVPLSDALFGVIKQWFDETPSRKLQLSDVLEIGLASGATHEEAKRLTTMFGDCWFERRNFTI